MDVAWQEHPRMNMEWVGTPCFGEHCLPDATDAGLRKNGNSASGDDGKEPRVAVSRSAIIRHVRLIGGHSPPYTIEQLRQLSSASTARPTPLFNSNGYWDILQFLRRIIAAPFRLRQRPELHCLRQRSWAGIELSKGFHSLTFGLRTLQ
jgi:hypothetical protein